MEHYIGKICPFCKTEITETDAIKVCPACGIPHHQSCWAANHGCTTFGCPEQHYEAQHTNPTAVCTNCGTPLGDDQAFCPKCGTPKNRPKKNICGKCGNELQEGQAFCPKCGQKAGLVVAPEVNSAINQFNANVQKKSKKIPKLPIILGAIAVIIVVLVLLLKDPSVKEIVLSETAITLNVGDSQSVSYTIAPDKASKVKVTWKSSNESVATVSSSGKISGKGDGSCKITVSAGGKTDSLTVTVKSGPNFAALYDTYCNSTWADCGSDGSYLSIDTNPYDWDDDGLAYPDAYYAIETINNALDLPGSLLKDMSETTSLDGKQSETYGDITVTWKYHPDKGLEVTYKAK